MIDYYDYLPKDEIQWNIDTWLEQGESPEQIDKWLKTQARIVQGEQIKASGTSQMKGGASFMGGLMLVMVFMMFLMTLLSLLF